MKKEEKEGEEEGEEEEEEEEEDEEGNKSTHTFFFSVISIFSHCNFSLNSGLGITCTCTSHFDIYLYD